MDLQEIWNGGEHMAGKITGGSVLENISYKLLTNIANFTPTGSIVAGLNQSANILQRGASVQEIVNMIYVSAQQAIKNKEAG